jgi:hypothetical protein
MFQWTNPQPWTSKDDSLSYMYNKTRARCRRVLEHIFHAHSVEVLESIIDCWNTNTLVRINKSFLITLIEICKAKNPDSETTGALELVDVLTSTAQKVVHLLCESIACRLPVVPDKHRKPISNTNLCVLFTHHVAN